MVFTLDRAALSTARHSSTGDAFALGVCLHRAQNSNIGSIGVPAEVAARLEALNTAVTAMGELDFDRLESAGNGTATGGAGGNAGGSGGAAPAPGWAVASGLHLHAHFPQSEDARFIPRTDWSADRHR